MSIIIKTKEEIEIIREGGRRLATVLQKVAEKVAPGISTLELDKYAEKLIKDMGDYPAFLNYKPEGADSPYPASVCISINDEIVHGIPSGRVVKDGDLVGLDFGVLYDGMITDSAVTVPVGKISKDAEKLLEYTERALESGIAVLKDGVKVGDIGAAIENTLIKGGLKVIETLGGHGVGHKVHEEPYIANFGTAGTGETLRAGMTIALEPIASLGTHDTDLADDDWTYVTRDHSLSAQFEHTLLITKDGSEILTKLR